MKQNNKPQIDLEEEFNEEDYSPFIDFDDKIKLRKDKILALGKYDDYGVNGMLDNPMFSLQLFFEGLTSSSKQEVWCVEGYKSNDVKKRDKMYKKISHLLDCYF